MADALRSVVADLWWIPALVVAWFGLVIWAFVRYPATRNPREIVPEVTEGSDEVVVEHVHRVEYVHQIQHDPVVLELFHHVERGPVEVDSRKIVEGEVVAERIEKWPPDES